MLKLFDYDVTLPIKLDPIEGPSIQNVKFDSPTGNRVEAYVVTPQGAGPFPGILWVHWYEPHSPNSNRTQFLSEALALAEEGVVSLLISTMWTPVDWFSTRKLDDDHDSSIRQVIHLRRSVDVLASLPKVDIERLGYVGHDFGAMYGAILASLDKRLKTFVLMAGTSCFSDWFLLGQKDLPDDQRQAYIEKMAKFDPVNFVEQAAPASVFLQFGDNDWFVPLEKAQSFFEAAQEPKKMEVYKAQHDLDDRARHFRRAWLREKLGFGEANT